MPQSFHSSCSLVLAKLAKNLMVLVSSHKYIFRKGSPTPNIGIQIFKSLQNFNDCDFTGFHWLPYFTG